MSKPSSGGDACVHCNTLSAGQQDRKEDVRTSKRSSDSSTSARTESKDLRTASAESRVSISLCTPEHQAEHTQVVVEQLARQPSIVHHLRRLHETFGRLKARARACAPQSLRLQLIARNPPSL